MDAQNPPTISWPQFATPGTVIRSVHIDYRWAAGSLDRMRLFAKDQLNPDALVT
jgi:hypothetical protein